MGAIQFTDRGSAVRVRPETRILAQAAVAALAAPSIFNSQPWRWRIAGGHAELRADRARQLHAVDPDGRMLIVSCGIALHHALTDLAARGSRVSVTRMPDPDDPDLLARIRVIGERPADPEATRLAAIMPVRHTDRRPFADQPVPEDDLKRLRRAAEHPGAHLHILRSTDLVGITSAAAQAAAAEHADPRVREDLATWTHRADSSADGIPRGEPSAGSVARPVPLRAFGDVPADAPGFGAPVGDRCARYVLLFTDGDRPADWLAAGEALSAVLLTATDLGLATSPMSDLVEVPHTRMRLKSLLSGVGHPVIVVRVGVAADDQPAGSARRRPATEIIEVVDEPDATGRPAGAG